MISGLFITLGLMFINIVIHILGIKLKRGTKLDKNTFELSFFLKHNPLYQFFFL